MRRLLASALALIPLSALAQWTETSASPFVAASRSGPQVQPKIAPTPDGGCYMGWFDNSTGGYDVYLQRFDRMGNELWPHNGILIADRSVSSTQDLDVDVDQFGNALVTFNDDRLGNAICVNKVNAAAGLPWGTNGTQIPSAGFLGFPKVSELTNGSIAVGYSVDSSYQWTRLDPAGGVVGTWAASETGKPYALCDLAPGLGGSVIISYQRRFNTTGNSARALWAQRYTLAGSPVWAQPVAIYAPTGTPYPSQGGSIQVVPPPLLSDGNGGVVCGWYEIGGPRNALVQHINPDGTLRFPLHGAPVVVTDATQIRVGCSVAYDPRDESVYAVVVQTNASTQSTYSVIAQRMSGETPRQWGELGVTVMGPSANQPSFANIGVGVNGIVVASQELRSSTTGIVYAAGLTLNGAPRWGVGTPFYVSSLDATGKGRLTMATSKDRHHILAWQDGDFSTADIHANRLNEEGYLGNYLEAYPSTLEVVQGSEFLGGLGELVLSDNVRASFFNDEVTLACRLRMSQGLGSVPSVIVLLELEGMVSRPGLARNAKLKRVSNGQYQVIFGSTAPIDEDVRRVVLTSFADYVIMDGQFDLEIEWTPINDEDPAQDGWLHELDQVRFMAR